MYSDEVRETAVARLSRGERVEALAAELNLSRQTLFYWKRQSCGGRKKRPIHTREFPGMWAYPGARAEALACLAIADANGGRSKMMELIRVTAADEKNLRRMVAEGQLSAHLVEKAIIFRRRVLEEFDALFEKSRTP
jgi:transposase-like protein